MNPATTPQNSRPELACAGDGPDTHHRTAAGEPAEEDATSQQMPSSATPRGRRPGKQSTAQEIAEAARAVFADIGYARATMRGIADAAGVDPALVNHYYGNKARLFAAVSDLPLDPAVLLAAIQAAPADQAGQALADVLCAGLTTPTIGQRMVMLVRAAHSEPEVAQLLRAKFTEQGFFPLARQLGLDRPELRASLCVCAVLGVVVGRFVCELPPLRQASAQQLAMALGPTLHHYLTGDLVE